MRFSRRQLRASVVNVIAAFAPLAGCSDALEVADKPGPEINPPAPICDSQSTSGCVPPVGTHYPEPVTNPPPPETIVPGRPGTDAAVIDAGPMDAAVVDTRCPAKAPSQGQACSTSATCEYEPYCGPRPTRLARCVNGRWDIAQTSCNPPPLECPDAAPVEDAGCTPGWGLRCDYGSCDGGTALTFQCNATSVGGSIGTPVWQVTQRCGAAVCPSSRPVHDSACDRNLGDTSCGYDYCNGHPATLAKCANGAWSVLSVSCNPPPPLCPGLAPAEDSACPTGQTCTFSLSAGGVVIGRCLEGKWKLGVADAGT